MASEKNSRSIGMGRTRDAVERQLRAMKSELYEVGLFRPATGDGQPEMLPRTWDAQTILDSLGWMRWQNSQGRNIFVRPAGEHQYSLVDDLTADAVRRMEAEGFTPAVVVETSPGNFQAWVNHGVVLPKDVSTAAARALAGRFGGDKGAADWRHFGRLSGFTNRKESRRLGNGLFPFVRLVAAREGVVYGRAGELVHAVRKNVERQHFYRSATRRPQCQTSECLSIEDFRRNPKYHADGNRIDLAYAIYAISNGRSEQDVAKAIGSRDLRKKGSDARQTEYVRRTISAARRMACNGPADGR